MKSTVLENLNKVNERIDLACEKIQKQNEVLKWIDDRCMEGLALHNGHGLNYGQAVTILQDIHSTIFEMGLEK
ncbi:MAG: hypothetical protein MJ181_10705 [Treponema sp.]|nr:hypothetical protein [Treponema sp.]